MNRELKDDYKRSIEIVRQILNDVDPEGFEPGQEDGAPIDEYDSEVTAIYNFVVHNLEKIKLNNNLLVDEICKIWMDNFNKNCNSATEITNQIIKELF